MKPTLKTIILGAGGVASYMLPALNNSFNLSGILIDGDILEEHNLDRQIFNKAHVGKHKSVALNQHHKLGLLPLIEYADENWILRNQEALTDIDLVICLVDNHPGRRAALNIAATLDIPIVIAANEYMTSQAMYFHPAFPNKAHPITRYGEIQTSNSGSPIRCTGEALESTPQLAMANQVSAGLANLLLWMWHGEDCFDPDRFDTYMPIEFQTTLSKIETVTLGDL